MFRSKFGIASLVIGYLAGLASFNFLHPAIALLFPIVGTMVAGTIVNAERKVRLLAAEQERKNAEQSSRSALDSGAVRQPGIAAGSQTEAGRTSGTSSGGAGTPSPQTAAGRNGAGQSAAAGTPAAGNPAAKAEVVSSLGPEWDSILEYIGTIEDMVLLEGEKNNLDNEIVQRTLSVLVRLNRIIPQLADFNNSEINHKIQRLVLKDLNGAINPFLNLSGEAKRQNRRILLNSLRDIDNQISEYTSFLEQKDLIDLRNKAELIHQRYGLKG